jgi:hypothetical protein
VFRWLMHIATRRVLIMLGFVAGCRSTTDGMADGTESGTGSETATGDSESAGESGDDSTETEGGEEESSPGAVCGNGVLEPGELCDGDELGGQTCEDLGFVGGELSCSDQCTIDATGCSEQLCGNNIIEGDEECDGSDLGGLNCTDLGMGPGLPLCTESCAFDTSTCMTLGEGDPCNGFTPCEGDLNCVSGTCYDGSEGDPCGNDGDCQSQDCAGASFMQDGECV